MQNALAGVMLPQSLGIAKLFVSRGGQRGQLFRPVGMRKLRVESIAALENIKRT
jgi:hypothetical protein